MSGFVKNFILAILILLVFSFPYGLASWWKFIPTTILIIGIFFISKVKNPLLLLGLKFKIKDLFYSGFIAIVSFFVFKMFILYILQANNIQLDDNEYTFEWKILPIFQAFNEELIFRALLLSVLLRFYKKKWVISVVIAGLFSLFHFIFYYIAQNTILNLTTSISLFLFALICNELYFHFNHILYGYALHVAWNLTRFTTNFSQGNKIVSEGRMFNILEGSTPVLMLLASIVVALLFIFYLHKKKEI